MKWISIYFLFKQITIKVVAVFLTLSTSFLFGQDSSGTVTDIDGNIYKTVNIGKQWWMAENLKVTHYQDGDMIPALLYCSYNNNDSNVVVYGLLYKWNAAHKNIAPEGWHLPTDEEWSELEMYLGMKQSKAMSKGGWRGKHEGSKLKIKGTDHWLSPNKGATNESGFSALPGGCRNHAGRFEEMGERAYFWTSTDYADVIKQCACYRALDYNHSDICRYGIVKYTYCSVRCIKD